MPSLNDLMPVAPQLEQFVQSGGTGQVKETSLAALFVRQVPTSGVQDYPLDTTMWAHPAARILEGLVYGPSPTSVLKRHSIGQGHEYSLLGWTATPPLQAKKKRFA